MTVAHTPLVAMVYYAVMRKALRRRRRSGWLYVFRKGKKKITRKSPQKVQFQGKTWKSSCFIIRYYNVAYFIAWSKKLKCFISSVLVCNTSCKTPNSSSQIKTCIKDKSNISPTCLRLAIMRKKVKKVVRTMDKPSFVYILTGHVIRASSVVQLNVNSGTRNSRFPQDFSSHYHGRRRHSTFLVLKVPNNCRNTSAMHSHSQKYFFL